MARQLRHGAFLVVLTLAGCATPPPARQYVVFFETDRTGLTPVAQQVVSEIVRTAALVHPGHIVIEGHADGGTPHDAATANRRAATVAAALEDAGIAPALIEQRPGAPPPDQSGVAAHKVVVLLQPGG